MVKIVLPAVIAPDAIWRIAVPTPLRSLFDYLPPAAYTGVATPGLRVRVPWGRRALVGVLIEGVEHSNVAPARMKRVQQVLDATPQITPALLRVLAWAAAYYQHAPGEVWASAFPVGMRDGRAAPRAPIRGWQLTTAGSALALSALRRTPAQLALMTWLQSHASIATPEQWAAQSPRWKSVLTKWVEQGWVVAVTENEASALNTTLSMHILNAAQRAAVDRVAQSLGTYQAFVLDGVTGSGKTEVYVQLITQVLARGQQVLVLVPEIGLTPQLVQRFRERFDTPIALLHSGLTDTERAQAWRRAQQAEARIVVGTRSAVFTPLPELGLIVVDEEHDLSFKQQDGFRYSARDVAVVRAREERVPIVLGSATPSLECLFNVQEGRYVHLSLPARAGTATSPTPRVVDLRAQPMRGPLSHALLEAMTHHLAAGHQVLLFLNRRGFAPTALCHACGWIARCERCDANFTLHQGSRRMRCHHCGAERPWPTTCPTCASTELRAIGAGTERVEEMLAELFPDIGIARVDRDSTRRVGALQELFDGIHAQRYRILIGTQMLAKGHHFPGVTLVGVLNTDQGLLGADFRASERMAQLLLQVSGRSGRGAHPGEVVIQTHFPEHPLLRLLLEQGYPAFAAAALQERRAAHLPPCSYLALLRAEAPGSDVPMRFLDEAKALASVPRGVTLLGPVPAPMEKRAGRFRAQLLVQSTNRGALHRFLGDLLPRIGETKSARRVRWSVDVDPQEMY